MYHLSGLVRIWNSISVELPSLYSVVIHNLIILLLILTSILFSVYLFAHGHIESEQGIFEQVLHGDLDFSSDPWPSISESAKDLVRRMLIRDPRRRLTVREVLSEYFNKNSLQHTWKLSMSITG